MPAVFKRPDLQTVRQLHERYMQSTEGIAPIATELGVGAATLTRWFKLFKLEIKPRGPHKGQRSPRLGKKYPGSRSRDAAAD